MSEDRRKEPRHAASFEVDYGSDETFVFAKATDISNLGIFISTPQPLPVGEQVRMRFTPPAPPADPRIEDMRHNLSSHRVGGSDVIEVDGVVRWTSTSAHRPGMGVEFTALDQSTRARIMELVRAVAYLGGQ